MRLPPEQLYDLFVDRRDAELARRVLEPLTDLGPSALLELAAAVDYAKARAMHLPISQAMAAEGVLGDLFRLIHMVRNL